MNKKLDKAPVIPILVERGVSEWRKRAAFDLLGKGEVTFAEAAGIAKFSLLEFADLVKQRKVEWVRFGSEEVEKEFKEASATQNR